VARADRGPLATLLGVFPARRLSAVAGGRDAGPGRRDTVRPGRAQLRRAVSGRRRDGRVRPGRGAGIRLRRAGAARRAGRRLRTNGASWSQAEPLDDLGWWAWRHWRITVDSRPETTRSSCASGAPRRPRSRRATPHPVEPEGLREHRLPAGPGTRRRR
jgi:hypothetical protein